MVRVFVVAFIIDIGILLSEDTYFILQEDINPFDYYIVIYQFCSLLFKMMVFTFTFLYLICLMYMYHNYEFKLRRFSMVSHFLFIVLFFVIHNSLTIKSNFCISILGLN